MCNFVQKIVDETSNEVMNEGCQTRRMYGHNYAVPGTYEVTMVVADRRPVFGEIIGTTKGGGEKPRLKLLYLGRPFSKTRFPRYTIIIQWSMFGRYASCLTIFT